MARDDAHPSGAAAAPGQVNRPSGRGRTARSRTRSTAPGPKTGAVTLTAPYLLTSTPPGNTRLPSASSTGEPPPRGIRNSPPSGGSTMPSSHCNQLCWTTLDDADAPAGPGRDRRAGRWQRRAAASTHVVKCFAETHSECSLAGRRRGRRPCRPSPGPRRTPRRSGHPGLPGRPAARGRRRSGRAAALG
jgi:hypothetical protein